MAVSDGAIAMFRDPIVERVRRVRQQHARLFGYDLRAIARDLRRQEQLHADRLVSFPPKAPREKRTA
jgi:hypothetical protein